MKHMHNPVCIALAFVGALFATAWPSSAADTPESMHTTCPPDLDPPPMEDPTECAAISVRRTDLAAKMALVWGPLAAGARHAVAAAASAPVSRTGGMLKIRSAANGPNGHPAFIVAAGAHGPVR
ncbi:MAG: hypothetical protein J6R80_02290, partial [Kiritimatiellae bacterium]|nr:hypothetical protein [Kiritimatiellia bacterium]